MVEQVDLDNKKEDKAANEVVDTDRSGWLLELLTELKIFRKSLAEFLERLPSR